MRAARRILACVHISMTGIIQCELQKATARGFEPLRAEPNGFLVHHLNHSVTLSCASVGNIEAHLLTAQLLYASFITH